MLKFKNEPSPKTYVVISRNREKQLKQNTDDYLMGQFQGGDESAFTILVNRHKRDIFNFVLLKIKDRDLASDLTQDVFIKLFNSIEQYQPAGKFKSWLLRIAHNVCIDQFRKKPKAVILSLMIIPILIIIYRLKIELWIRKQIRK